MRSFLSLWLTAATIHGVAAEASSLHVHHRLRPVTSFPALQDHPSVTNCTVEYFNQRIDHFRPTVSQNDNAEPSHFKQRYFVCQQNEWKPGAPVFFYVGNEADVTLYVNATGLMWERLV